MVLPDDKRYSEARLRAAVSVVENFYAHDDRITPALILGARDSNVDPTDLADAIDAYHAAIKPVADYKRKQRDARRANLRMLTQESQPYT